MDCNLVIDCNNFNSKCILSCLYINLELVAIDYIDWTEQEVAENYFSYNLDKELAIMANIDNFDLNQKLEPNMIAMVSNSQYFDRELSLHIDFEEAYNLEWINFKVFVWILEIKY